LLSRGREMCIMISAQLPSFFVVGPPRTGTSWIYRALQRHANLPAPTKETRFFDCHFHRGLRWYARHFPAIDPQRPTGEVAPTYFASSRACEAIAQTLPDAKLIFIFRDPLQRLVSLYRLKRAYGLLDCSFEQALAADPELLASASYATCLQNWQQAFSRRQMLITLYEDLRNSPQSYIDKLLNFLGLPASPLTDAELKYVHSSERLTEPRNFLLTHAATRMADWCKARNLDHIVATVRNSRMMSVLLSGGPPFPEVSQAARERVGELLQPEIEGLERMIDRDLSMWDLSGSRATMAASARTEA
jgi:sulfotransferase family protein